MKSVKRGLRRIGLILAITLASFGIGFNAAILPSFKKMETNQPLIEWVESREEESEIENDEKR